MHLGAWAIVQCNPGASDSHRMQWSGSRLRRQAKRAMQTLEPGTSIKAETIDAPSAQQRGGYGSVTLALMNREGCIGIGFSVHQREH